MRYALIDNSTLTGVQRLLGQITVKNTLVEDMDILCLESLVEAILFYDELLVIDDYKPYFREDRKRTFPYLTFLGTDVISFQELTRTTKSLTESIVPRVEGGQFTDQDFKPFFEMLKMNVTFTWDMASSVYYLTQKMLAGVGGLDLKKYSQLSSAIHNELSDKGRAVGGRAGEGQVVLIDRWGNPIGGDYLVVDKEGNSMEARLSPQVSAFFAGLNWLAFRAIFYTLAAKALGADLFLHPIRHAFHANFIPKLLKEDTSTFKPLLDAMNDAANASINKILGTTQPLVTKQPIPLFVTWLAKKTGDPARFVEAAHELRWEAPFAEARARLIELEASLAEEKFTAEANRLLGEVDKALEGIVSKYGASTTQGVSLSSIITLWNIGAVVLPLPKLPAVNARVSRLEFLKHAVPRKGFKGLYRSLVSDLAGVSRLGKYHEVITSRMRLEEEAGEHFVKTEPAEYRRAKSSFKVPM